MLHHWPRNPNTPALACTISFEPPLTLLHSLLTSRALLHADCSELIFFVKFFPCWVSIEVNVWMMSHEVNFQPRHRKKAERATFLLDIQLFKTRMTMLQRGIQTISKKTRENTTIIIIPVDVLKSNSRKQTSITNSKDNNL